MKYLGEWGEEVHMNNESRRWGRRKRARRGMWEDEKGEQLV